MTSVSAQARYCVLDDEISFLELARRNLTKLLPEVNGIFFSDPDDVIRIAPQNQRLLYIFDIRLGNRNGIDLYRDITRIAPHSRVIFVTGDVTYLDDDKLRERALSHGGIDFIEKPVKWHELALKIQNHLKLIEYQFDLEEKVQERTRMLIHADRLATVGTMVSSIVHEVNSPLTFIKVNVETIGHAVNQLREKTSNEEQKLLVDTLEPIIRDSLQGIRQIEELLKSFRRFYKQEKNLSAVEITSVIEDVRLLASYNLRRHTISFVVDNRSSEPLTVWGNRQELIQAVTNLVSNAVDAFEGSAIKERKIVIKIEQDAERITLTVANNGPKIPPDIASMIFEPFFTTKSGERGTGLGLSIVRQIMRGMGGDIVLRNREQGSDFVEFVCTMPIYRERRRTVMPL